MLDQIVIPHIKSKKPIRVCTKWYCKASLIINQPFWMWIKKIEIYKR